MKPITAFFDYISSWKTLLIFLTLYLFFSAFLLRRAENNINNLAGKTVGVIDLTVGFNPQQTLRMVADYGNKGRVYYARTTLTTDIAFPLVYACLFSITLTLLFRKKPHDHILLLPALNMLFDFAENATIVMLLNRYPAQSIFIATICETVKLLKWMSFGLIILIIAYGFATKLMKKLKIIQAP